MTTLPPEQSLGYQVRCCHRAFDRLLNAYLRKHRIKSGFWYYLRALWLEDGATQKRLSDMTNVTETTTVSVIDRMVKDGLVTRSRDTNDRRKLLVFQTKKSRSLEPKLMPYAFEINAIAIRGLSEKDIKTCLTVLKHMSENLQQAFKEDR